MSKLDQRSEARLCELYGKKEEAAHMRGSLLVQLLLLSEDLGVHYLRRPRALTIAR